ncbi:cobalamin B12-binding domain-containing protein [Methylobacter tundripaludum]|uniref:Cobalamin B12-binding domain protein n=1 Tax=Methylobacter tundripaludum (strain ATCC BAA-1195 / DSM 17260 / SV96) TaxID=697282 RepID=G3IWJ0_METTV|nr:cobalamin-dependent protein [Methylobacter tundripaludum]EGW21929.1 cobalamin B12-binding domain protein [Methylobacter tundripaludum SV96]
MILEKVIAAYSEAVFDTDRDKAFEVIHEAIAQGVTPEDIVFKVVIPSMEQMIKAISEDFDANLAQHFMASQIASQVTDEMVAQFQTSPETIGRVVIGTSHGDMHTLGKRIVSGCLRSLMIDVIDLGVNVSAERFVDTALEQDAGIIAISSMMVHTARSEYSCLAVRELLKQRRLEDRIKIIVGGAPYTWDRELYKVVQADAWASDGISAGKVIKDLIMEMHK